MHRYQRQFKADFRVRKRHVMTWLYFLQAHHPDYRYTTLSYARLESLPEDGDVSDAFSTIVDAESQPADPVDDNMDPSPHDAVGRGFWQRADLCHGFSNTLPHGPCRFQQPPSPVR